MQPLENHFTSKDSFYLSVGDEQIILRTSSTVDPVSSAWNVDRHSNGEYELHLFLKGSCNVEIEDRKEILKKGELLIIEPNRYHSARSGLSSIHISMGFFVQGEKLQKQLQGIIKDYSIKPLTDEMEKAAKDYLKECSQADCYSQQIKSSLLTVIMVAVLRQYNITMGQKDKGTEVSISKMDIIDQFFESSFAEKTGEQMLANLLEITPRHLSRIVFSYYGMSFREKVAKTRMDKAKWLLENTDDAIKDIAIATGYSSDTAFSRMFSKQEGISAEKYRRKTRERKHNG